MTLWTLQLKRQEVKLFDNRCIYSFWLGPRGIYFENYEMMKKKSGGEKWKKRAKKRGKKGEKEGKKREKKGKRGKKREKRGVNSEKSGENWVKMTQKINGGKMISKKGGGK